MQNRIVQLIVNSKDREDYNSTSSSNFIVKLQNPINYDILGYGLESCCIPKTNYNITSGNFEIEVLSVVSSINITPGNYSVNDLLVALKTQLDLIGTNVYTLSVSTITSKLTIASNTNEFIINPNETSSTFLQQIGFNNEIAYTSVGLTLESPKVIDISGIKNVYIKVDQLSEYMRDTKNLSSNFKVDYGCSYGSIVYFSNQSKYLQYYETAQNHIRRTDKFDVRLVDEIGDDIDLNGSDWTFVLKLLVRDLY